MDCLQGPPKTSEMMNGRSWRAVCGVALVTVMAILVVLALLAAVLVTSLSIERLSGESELGRSDAVLLANSALEHVEAMLRLDAYEQPAWDAYDEPWSQRFRPMREAPQDAVILDGGRGATISGHPAAARWYHVRDRDGVLIGRYAVVIEDEAAKINVNVARSFGPQMQH